MKWKIFNWILLPAIILLNEGLSVQGTECSPENRARDLNTCLTKIKEELLNPSRFWFGNDYANTCINNDPTLCSNFKPSGISIATRIFDSTVPLSSLDRFVELRYESGGKDYTGCGNTFKTTETWSYDVDPLSDTIVNPWYVKNFPISNNWSYEPGDLFTLIVYDVGYFVTHGIYINIQGDDMTTAEVIKYYHGPLSTSDYHNPYIFLLYKQKGPLQITPQWTMALNQSFQAFNFEQMATGLNLTGPVGANFIVSTGDEYAASLMLSNGFIANCPVFVTRALKTHSRPFVPSDVRLTVDIEFGFTNEELEFSICCKSYKYPARDFLLNPIGNPLYPTAEVRTENPHRLSFRKLGLYMNSKNFTGNTYMLIAFDPDVPITLVGTETRPLLHGLVTNIVNGDMSTGHDGLEYQGPRPPNSDPHTYYTFLYEQQGKLNATELMMKYDGDNCMGAIVGRCLFDINRLVSENNLTLVGATWFRSTRDPYVIKRAVDRGSTEPDECENEPNYPKACDTSGSAIMTSSFIVVLLVCFIERIVSSA